MCIGIEKISDTDAYVDYAFVADVYGPRPGERRGSIVVGQNKGLLRIVKATGDITLLKPMPEDDGEKRFKRAAQKIWKHWKAGEFPDRTQYACG